MRQRLAVILEYQGSRYCGFQVQPQLPTVQGELERALEALYGEHVKTYGASRTDAGAHARGQVAAFDAPRDYPPRAVMGALNASLPGDVRVREAFEAPGSFDPRRHAASREYRYLVLNQKRPSVFWRGYAWHVPQSLDVEAMQRAADGLLGCHDFRAFAGSLRDPLRSTRRRVFRADVLRRGGVVTFVMEAEAFLPHQVRRSAGALVQVGKAEMEVASFHRLIEEGVGEVAGPALPASGLYLERVTYPEGLLAQSTDRTSADDND